MEDKKKCDEEIDVKPRFNLRLRDKKKINDEGEDNIAAVKTGEENS